MKFKALDPELGEVRTFEVVRCGHCGRYNLNNSSYKFCPYCGAKIDGGGKRRKRKGITNDDAIYIWEMIDCHGLPEDFYEFATSCDIDPGDAYVVLDEIGKFVHSHDWYGATSRDE